MDATIERTDDGARGAFVIANEPGAEPALLAEMTYVWQDGVMVITHTGVREALRGQGIAGRLVHTAVASAREEGFRIRPVCPFARRVFEGEPDLADVRA